VSQVGVQLVLCAVSRRFVGLCWGLLALWTACGVCRVRSTKERNTRPPLLTAHKDLSGCSTFSSTVPLCVCFRASVRLCMFHSFQTKVILHGFLKKLVVNRTFLD
jgi:hypothetical protein